MTLYISSKSFNKDLFPVGLLWTTPPWPNRHLNNYVYTNSDTSYYMHSKEKTGIQFKNILEHNHLHYINLYIKLSIP